MLRSRQNQKLGWNVGVFLTQVQQKLELAYFAIVVLCIETKAPVLSSLEACASRNESVTMIIHAIMWPVKIKKQ